MRVSKFREVLSKFHQTRVRYTTAPKNLYKCLQKIKKTKYQSVNTFSCSARQPNCPSIFMLAQGYVHAGRAHLLGRHKKNSSPVRENVEAAASVAFFEENQKKSNSRIQRMGDPSTSAYLRRSSNFVNFVKSL